jgi:putative DNA primase/helicase
MLDGKDFPDLDAVLALRKRLSENGYRPIAVQTGGKAPVGPRWQLRAMEDPPEAAVLPAEPEATSTGILCNGLRAVDLDLDNPKLADKVTAAAIKFLGNTIIRYRENSSRCLLLYRAAAGEPPKRTITGASHTTKRACKVEVLGRGQQFVGHGIHETGTPLLWRDGRGPEHVPLAELPVVSENQIAVFLLEAGILIDVPMPVERTDGPHTSGNAAADSFRVIGALGDIPNEGPADWDWWNRVCMAVWRATNGDGMAWVALDTWSRRNLAYDPDLTRERWDHYRTSPPTEIGAGTIFWMAREARQAKRDAAGAPELEAAPLPDLEEQAQHAPVLDPAHPIMTAEWIVRSRQRAGADLRTHQDVVHQFTGSHYVARSDEWARAEMYRELRDLKRRGKDKLEHYGTTKQRIADALAAVKGVTAQAELPAWIGGTPPFPLDELLITTSGIVHVPTRALIPHDPAFLCVNALPYAFDQAAPSPVAWLRFLEQLWPNDTGEIAALQEWFGLCLTPVTRFQKMLMVVGPRRGGKGTIARLLTALVGKDNVGSPTLAGLGERFGLQPLIGKRVAIIADARLSGRTDLAAVTERLLNLSGEDTQNIDRKHISTYIGRLDARVVLMSNELPKFTDASGAIASRFIYLNLQNSWLDREDLTLADRLLTELPGILNWAIDGWQRLSRRGRFVMPDASAAIAQRMEFLTSSIRSFVRERCVVDPHTAVPKAMLYERWNAFCRDEGLRQTSSAVFGKWLFAAFPTINEFRPRQDGDQQRVNHYRGIRLADASEAGAC